jgi:hypothetical protein
VTRIDQRERERERELYDFEFCVIRCVYSLDRVVSLITAGKYRRSVKVGHEVLLFASEKNYPVRKFLFSWTEYRTQWRQANKSSGNVSWERPRQVNFCCTQQKIKSRLNLRKAYFHLSQYLLSTRSLSINLKIKQDNITFRDALLCWCQNSFWVQGRRVMRMTSGERCLGVEGRNKTGAVKLVTVKSEQCVSWWNWPRMWHTWYPKYFGMTLYHNPRH